MTLHACSRRHMVDDVQPRTRVIGERVGTSAILTPMLSDDPTPDRGARWWKTTP